MTTTRRPPIVAGKKAVQDKIPGINRVKATLADGSEAYYYYHRATGTKLPGPYGSDEFLKALANAKAGAATRHTAGTLAGLIRAFEGTAKWRKLAESTKKEYKRVFKFWDAKFGDLPTAALAAKGFRQDVLEWHDEFSADHPREADNRVTILARVLSWAASDRSLKTNVLDGFERAYASDRAETIWLPGHVEAFLAAAPDAMQLALMLALHTGQRQADILKMAWSQYDGAKITLRQGKARRGKVEGRTVTVPCTTALKATLDQVPRRGVLILLTKTGLAYKKRRFAQHWDDAYKAAKLPLTEDGKPALHFHDLRGTAVTKLFEAGCNVAEVVAITGHTIRSAQTILDQYLARTGSLAQSAIAKLEHRTETERAKDAAK